jgi:hypothetical protein
MRFRPWMRGVGDELGSFRVKIGIVRLL